MRKSKIFAPVGFNPKPATTAPVSQNRRMYNDHLRAWYTSDDGGLSWKREAQQETKAMQKMQETQAVTVSASLGFSLDLIPTGKFVTVEFVNKYGVIRRYNGRTGVKKYLKHTGYRSEETRKKYFVLWIRRDSQRFDGVAMIEKTKIIRLSAGGVVLWSNKDSRYTKTV